MELKLLDYPLKEGIPYYRGWFYFFVVIFPHNNKKKERVQLRSRYSQSLSQYSQSKIGYEIRLTFS